MVITGPHESDRKVRANIERGDSHGYIHSPNLSSFNFAKDYHCEVLSRKIPSPLLLIPASIIDAKKRGSVHRIPKVLMIIHDFRLPVLRQIFGKWSAALLIRLEWFLAMIPRLYEGIRICSHQRAWLPVRA